MILTIIINILMIHIFANNFFVNSDFKAIRIKIRYMIDYKLVD